MKDFFEVLKHSPLFHHISLSEFETMHSCIGARVQRFSKNEIILLTGNRVDFIGIVLSGSVKILNETADGDVSIDAILFPPEMFAESLACAEITHSPVTVIAAEDCEVMFFDYTRVIRSCSSACSFHSRLVENMLLIMAKKNLMQKEKIAILSSHSLRERLLIFLELQRKRCGSSRFEIPYNREELADYLCVNRSTMSSELSKMRDEGLIKFEKNRFELTS
jgi:CRP-like cAMP-binding protein